MLRRKGCPAASLVKASERLMREVLTRC
jgi:hypothetical protein